MGLAGSAIKNKLNSKGYGIDTIGELQTASREELDLRNRNEVDKWVMNNKPDVVIIAAASVGGIQANYSMPAKFILDNLKIATNLIESSWENGVRRLCYLGSSCMYPKDCKQPIKPEYLLTGSLEETNEAYALAKISGLKICEYLYKQYGFDAFTVIPNNMYGIGDDYGTKTSHVIGSLIRKFAEAKESGSDDVICWGTGTPTRDFLNSHDMAEAVVHCLEYWSPEGIRHINIGSGTEISIRELAKLIAKKLNYNGKIRWDTSRPDGMQRKLLCTAEINKLGWDAKIDIESGIETSIHDYYTSKNQSTLIN